MAADERPWKKRVLIALYVFAFANVAVSVERAVFDALGQMWVILFANGIAILATLVCILGVLCKKNTAILGFIVCTFVALGVNVIILLIFNDIGVFKDKDSYLSLNINDKHWWRDHGLLCYTVCSHGDGGENANSEDIDGGSSGDLAALLDQFFVSETQFSANNDNNNSNIEIKNCFASYVVIETVHASVNMILMVVTIILSVFSLSMKTKSRQLIPSEDNDSFRYVGVGRYGGNAPRTNPKQPSFYKLSDNSFDLSSVSNSSSN